MTLVAFSLMLLVFLMFSPEKLTDATFVVVLAVSTALVCAGEIASAIRSRK